MKKQTEIMFFFDTEDYTSVIAAEAIKREADILTEEGITGHLFPCHSVPAVKRSHLLPATCL